MTRREVRGAPGVDARSRIAPAARPGHRRRPVQFTIGVAALSLGVVSMAGCASTEAGMGLPTLSLEDSAKVLAARPAGSLHGTLRVAPNGCFVWEGVDGAPEDGAWIVWPDSARQNADAVVLASSDRVMDGDGLTAKGAVVPLTALPGGDDQQGSYFGSFGHYCSAGDRGVLVLTEIAVGSPD